MKKKNQRILAAVLAVLLLCGGTGIIAYAAGTSRASAPVQDVKEAEQTAAGPEEIKKDETVYVIAGADGSVQKVIVSDWIKNSIAGAQMEDKSSVEDLSNAAGDESYVMNADNMRVWDADGNGIDYEGAIEKELPVNIRISYTLDGKPVSPEEIAGKSGKVAIRFDYENNQAASCEIDGKTEDLYVPFVMLTGMILDNENFQNVEVSNGKIIQDGDRAIVIGFALPGLQEDLNIDAADYEIPNSVEITADAENFALATTLSFATNSLFNDVDLDKLDDLDELEASADGLRDASAQLVDGSSELYSGLETLFEKSGELSDGVKELYDGAVSLYDGACELYDGSSALYDGVSELLDKSDELIDGINRLYDGAVELQDGAGDLQGGTSDLYKGAKELRNGLKKLESNSDTLDNGAKQVFESILETADSQLALAGVSAPKLTIGNYASVLNGILANLDGDAIYNAVYNTVASTVRGQEEAIRAQVQAAVQKQVLEGVLASVGQPMTAEEYEAAAAMGAITEEQQQQINAAVAEQMASDTIKAQISGATEAQIQSIINEKMNSDAVKAQLEAAQQEASAGAGSIKALKAQLDSYNEFYKGLRAYTSGVATAYSGAMDLADGAKELYNGSNDLYEGVGKLVEGIGELQDGGGKLQDGVGELKDGAGDLRDGTGELQDGTSDLRDGVGELKDGSDALIDGVGKLKDGAGDLRDGMKKFDEEGIQKLVDTIKGDIGGFADRLRATLELSKDYQTFSGLSDGMEGDVKFIYKTAAVE